jgi:predicted Abi (CAAX) family protease
MPRTTLLDALPLWLLVCLIAVLLAVMIELGYRFGRYRKSHAAREMEAPVGTIVGATLGMLGFLLAFTFGLAASRFDERRQMVVEEANAIGTAYLRAGLLPDLSAVQSLRGLFKQYVDLRLETARTQDPKLAIGEAEALQQQMWERSEVVGREHPESIVVGLFIESLNAVIDVHSKRLLVALRNRLPASLWGVLLIVTCLTMLGVGYHEGLVKSQRSPSVLIMLLSFCLVFMLIADLDRPREGTLQVSQEAMESLRATMQQLPSVPAP